LNFNREFGARGHARVVDVSALTSVAALAVAGLLSAALAPAWRLALVPGAFVAVVAACLLATVLLLVSVHDGEDARDLADANLLDYFLRSVSAAS
jgi:hypothetical protein